MTFAPTAIPTFLDVEASSLGPRSFPISIAWNDASGSITRLLINPSAVPDWTDWDPASEAMHEIERERLLRNGWEPDYVQERLVRDLRGQTVYSDAPVFDEAWLERLAKATASEVPCRLAHSDDVFLHILKRPQDMVYETVLRLERLKEQVRKAVSARHDAGWDVGYLIQLWRACQGLPVKMGHGNGPLPPSTDTGTFLRVKPLA